MSQIIAFFSGKGGVAKTSNLVGVTTAAAQREVEENGEKRKMRVLVVDGDPRGTATNELGIEVVEGETYTLNDLLAVDPNDPMDAADAIEQVIHPSGEDWPDNVYVIPAERALENREMDPAPFEKRLGIGLRSLLQKGMFDLILIDNPPRAGGRLVNALISAAEAIVVPATLTTDGELGAREARQTMKVMRAYGTEGVAYLGVVLSDVPTPSKRLKIHDVIQEIIEGNFEGEIAKKPDGEYLKITHFAVREHARLANWPLTTLAENPMTAAAATALLGMYGDLLDYITTGKDLMLRG